MQKIPTLQHGKYYHIYNCGINGENLFKETINYKYFLSLYDKHIDPIAETFSWCLMPNHFHLLIRIRDLSGFENLTGREEIKPPHQYFSNLYNAYTKAINKKYNRHGSLFERPFKRKLIDNKRYLKQVILYIHNNPVHHGFCDQPMDYPWSSYLTCISLKSTKLQRDAIIGWFDDKADFKYKHNDKIETEKIEAWLEI